MSARLEDTRLSKARERQAAALPGFERWSRFLHLREFGWSVPAFQRLHQAQQDVREWRQASNTVAAAGEQVALAVRLTADTFASEISAAAGQDQDAATVAWVVAGLRCPRMPFCTGCRACPTVAAPHRPANDREGLW